MKRAPRMNVNEAVTATAADQFLLDQGSVEICDWPWPFPVFQGSPN